MCKNEGTAAAAGAISPKLWHLLLQQGQFCRLEIVSVNDLWHETHIGELAFK